MKILMRASGLRGHDQRLGSHSDSHELKGGKQMDFKVLAGNIDDGKVCIAVCYIVGVSVGTDVTAFGRTW